MKNKFLINTIYLLLFFISTISLASDVYVKGYTKSNGTTVEGYFRTAPDSTINNNYSTQGNVNPYTGKPGTVPRESIGIASTYSDTGKILVTSKEENIEKSKNSFRFMENKSEFKLIEEIQGIDTIEGSSFIASDEKIKVRSNLMISLFAIKIDPESISKKSQAIIRNETVKCHFSFSIDGYTKDVPLDYTFSPDIELTSNYHFKIYSRANFMGLAKQFESWSLFCNAGRQYDFNFYQKYQSL